MHITSAIALVISALQLTSVLAVGDCPSSLATYYPAQNTCSKYYPVQTVTLSVTSSPTMTQPVNHEGAITSKPLTTSQSGKRTITSIIEKTVTNCRSAVDFSTCKIALPTNLGSVPVAGGILQDFGLAAREAAPEADPDPSIFGNIFGGNPALTWMGIVAKGPAAVESACACIQGPAKTITASVPSRS